MKRGGEEKQGKVTDDNRQIDEYNYSKQKLEFQVKCAQNYTSANTKDLGLKSKFSVHLLYVHCQQLLLFDHLTVDITQNSEREIHLSLAGK